MGVQARLFELGRTLGVDGALALSLFSPSPDNRRPSRACPTNLPHG
jgi:hypothetical protein